MRRSLRHLFGSAAVLGLAAGCAHGNGTSAAGAVRVATSTQEVQGCDKLSEVRLSGTWTSGAGREELENLVRSKGGNVLLLSDGGKASSGMAYRCSAGTASGSP